MASHNPIVTLFSDVGNSAPTSHPLFGQAHESSTSSLESPSTIPTHLSKSFPPTHLSQPTHSITPSSHAMLTYRNYMLFHPLSAPVFDYSHPAHTSFHSARVNTILESQVHHIESNGITQFNILSGRGSLHRNDTTDSLSPHNHALYAPNSVKYRDKNITSNQSNKHPIADSNLDISQQPQKRRSSSRSRRANPFLSPYGNTVGDINIPTSPRSLLLSSSASSHSSGAESTDHHPHHATTNTTSSDNCSKDSVCADDNIGSIGCVNTPSNNFSGTSNNHSTHCIDFDPPSQPISISPNAVSLQEAPSQLHATTLFPSFSSLELVPEESMHSQNHDQKPTPQYNQENNNVEISFFREKNTLTGPFHALNYLISHQYRIVQSLFNTLIRPNNTHQSDDKTAQHLQKKPPLLLLQASTGVFHSTTLLISDNPLTSSLWLYNLYHPLFYPSDDFSRDVYMFYKYSISALTRGGNDVIKRREKDGVLSLSLNDNSNNITYNGLSYDDFKNPYIISSIPPFGDVMEKNNHNNDDLCETICFDRLFAYITTHYVDIVTPLYELIKHSSYFVHNKTIDGQTNHYSTLFSSRTLSTLDMLRAVTHVLFPDYIIPPTTTANAFNTVLLNSTHHQQNTTEPLSHHDIYITNLMDGLKLVNLPILVIFSHIFSQQQNIATYSILTDSTLLSTVVKTTATPSSYENITVGDYFISLILAVNLLSKPLYIVLDGLISHFSSLYLYCSTVNYLTNKYKYDILSQKTSTQNQTTPLPFQPVVIITNHVGCGYLTDQSLIFFTNICVVHSAQILYHGEIFDQKHYKETVKLIQRQQRQHQSHIGKNKSNNTVDFPKLSILSPINSSIFFKRFDTITHENNSLRNNPPPLYNNEEDIQLFNPDTSPLNLLNISTDLITTLVPENNITTNCTNALTTLFLQNQSVKKQLFLKNTLTVFLNSLLSNINPSYIATYISNPTLNPSITSVLQNMVFYPNTITNTFPNIPTLRINPHVSFSLQLSNILSNLIPHYDHTFTTPLPHVHTHAHTQLSLYKLNFPIYNSIHCDQKDTANSLMCSVDPAKMGNLPKALTTTYEQRCYQFHTLPIDWECYKMKELTTNTSISNDGIITRTKVHVIDHFFANTVPTTSNVSVPQSESSISQSKQSQLIKLINYIPHNSIFVIYAITAITMLFVSILFTNLLPIDYYRHSTLYQIWYAIIAFHKIVVNYTNYNTNHANLCNPSEIYNKRSHSYAHNTIIYKNFQFKPHISPISTILGSSYLLGEVSVSLLFQVIPLITLSYLITHGQSLSFPSYALIILNMSLFSILFDSIYAMIMTISLKSKPAYYSTTIYDRNSNLFTNIWVTIVLLLTTGYSSGHISELLDTTSANKSGYILFLSPFYWLNANITYAQFSAHFNSYYGTHIFLEQNYSTLLLSTNYLDHFYHSVSTFSPLAWLVMAHILLLAFIATTVGVLVWTILPKQILNGNNAYFVTQNALHNDVVYPFMTLDNKSPPQPQLDAKTKDSSQFFAQKSKDLQYFQNTVVLQDINHGITYNVNNYNTPMVLLATNIYYCHKNGPLTSNFANYYHTYMQLSITTPLQQKTVDNTTKLPDHENNHNKLLIVSQTDIISTIYNNVEYSNNRSLYENFISHFNLPDDLISVLFETFSLSSISHFIFPSPISNSNNTELVLAQYTPSSSCGYNTETLAHVSPVYHVLLTILEKYLMSNVDIFKALFLDCTVNTPHQQSQYNIILHITPDALEALSLPQKIALCQILNDLTKISIFSNKGGNYHKLFNNIIVALDNTPLYYGLLNNFDYIYIIAPHLIPSKQKPQQPQLQLPLQQDNTNAVVDSEIDQDNPPNVEKYHEVVIYEGINALHCNDTTSATILSPNNYSKTTQSSSSDMSVPGDQLTPQQHGFVVNNTHLEIFDMALNILGRYTTTTQMKSSLPLFQDHSTQYYNDYHASNSNLIASIALINDQPSSPLYTLPFFQYSRILYHHCIRQRAISHVLPINIVSTIIVLVLTSYGSQVTNQGFLGKLIISIFFTMILPILYTISILESTQYNHIEQKPQQQTLPLSLSAFQHILPTFFSRYLSTLITSFTYGILPIAILPMVIISASMAQTDFVYTGKGAMPAEVFGIVLSLTGIMLLLTFCAHACILACYSLLNIFSQVWSDKKQHTFIFTIFYTLYSVIFTSGLLIQHSTVSYHIGEWFLNYLFFITSPLSHLFPTIIKSFGLLKYYSNSQLTNTQHGLIVKYADFINHQQQIYMNFDTFIQTHVFSTIVPWYGHLLIFTGYLAGIIVVTTIFQFAFLFRSRGIKTHHERQQHNQEQQQTPPSTHSRFLNNPLSSPSGRDIVYTPAVLMMSPTNQNNHHSTNDKKTVELITIPFASPKKPQYIKSQDHQQRKRNNSIPLAAVTDTNIHSVSDYEIDGNIDFALPTADVDEFDPNQFVTHQDGSDNTSHGGNDENAIHNIATIVLFSPSNM